MESLYDFLYFYTSMITLPPPRVKRAKLDYLNFYIFFRKADHSVTAALDTLLHYSLVVIFYFLILYRLRILRYAAFFVAVSVGRFGCCV